MNSLDLNNKKHVKDLQKDILMTNGHNWKLFHE